MKLRTYSPDKGGSNPGSDFSVKLVANFSEKFRQMDKAPSVALGLRNTMKVEMVQHVAGPKGPNCETWESGNSCNPASGASSISTNPLLSMMIGP